MVSRSWRWHWFACSRRRTRVHLVREDAVDAVVEFANIGPPRRRGRGKSDRDLFLQRDPGTGHHADSSARMMASRDIVGDEKDGAPVRC